MLETLTNIICDSIPKSNSETLSRRTGDESNLDLFVNNLVEKSGLTPIELFPSVIMAYLNNEFELTFVDRLCKNLHVAKSINKEILTEPDLLFRMINYIKHCINLTDALLGPPLRYEGLKILFNLFKQRKLFSYLNYIEADVYQNLFLLKAVRQQLMGYNTFDFFEGTIDFPLSIVSKLIHEINNNQNLLQDYDLIKFILPNHFQIQVKVQPALMNLLNE